MENDNRPLYRRAFEAGIPVFPLDINKKPLVRWKQFTEKLPTGSQFAAWVKRRDVSCWARPTGKTDVSISLQDTDVLDFDGPEGLEQLERFKLQPHFMTPGGGRHVYLESYGLKSRVGILPGVDVRAEGAYVAFDGYAASNHCVIPSATGGYYERISRHPLLTLEDLPHELRDALFPQQNTGYDKRPGKQVGADELLKRALEIAHEGNRNDTGFWLACQLRNSGCSELDAEPVLREYARHQDNNYTEKEALDSLRSAYQQVARAPWGTAPDETPAGEVVETAIMTAGELFDKDLEDWKEIIPDLLVEGTTVVSGPPKIGKSFLSTQMSAAIAGGREVLGRPTRRSKVLYVSLEDGESLVQERLHTYYPGKELPADIAENLHLRFELQPLAQGGLEQLDAELTKGRYDVCIIDTLAKARGGVTEGKGSVFQNEYQEISKLRDLGRRHKLALVIVHHTRKGATKNDALDAISGTHGLSAAADHHILIFSEGGRVEFVVKGRRILEHEINVELKPDEGGWIAPTPPPLTTKALSATAQKVLECVKANPDQSPKEIALSAGLHRSIVRRLLSRELKGRVSRTGERDSCTVRAV